VLHHNEAVDFLRRYDGVRPEILADGTWLLERRTFWASLMYGLAEEDLLDALFGSGEEAWLTDQIDNLHEEIEQSGKWPVLRLGTRASDFAIVAWHGHGTEGYDFVVLPGGDRCISVASVEGGFYGPGLYWPEAERLIERGHLGSTAQRLLLLLRALGDADTPTDVVGQAAKALLAVGNATCSYEIAVEAAQQLLKDETRWTMHGEVLLCDGRHAVRRPGGLPPEDLLKLTRALQ
jgi:hypothetical protein